MKALQVNQSNQMSHVPAVEVVVRTTKEMIVIDATVLGKLKVVKSPNIQLHPTHLVATAPKWAGELRRYAGRK